MTPDIEVSHSPEAPAVYAAGGAMRSGRLPKYRLIPAAALRIEAEAFAEGNSKYERAADGTHTGITSNWRRGNLDFFLDVADHLTAHVAQFNNMLLEFALDYQNPALEGNGDVFDHTKARLLEELGHARANTAFLAEWLDSGAAGVQIVEEVERLNAEATLRSPAIPNDPQFFDTRLYQNAGATLPPTSEEYTIRPEGKEVLTLTPEEQARNHAAWLYAQMGEKVEENALTEGLLPRSFKQLIGKALGR